jgi:hypothetical protein
MTWALPSSAAPGPESWFSGRVRTGVRAPCEGSALPSGDAWSRCPPPRHAEACRRVGSSALVPVCGPRQFSGRSPLDRSPSCSFLFAAVSAESLPRTTFRTGRYPPAPAPKHGFGPIPRPFAGRSVDILCRAPTFPSISRLKRDLCRQRTLGQRGSRSGQLRDAEAPRHLPATIPPVLRPRRLGSPCQPRRRSALAGRLSCLPSLGRRTTNFLCHRAPKRAAAPRSRRPPVSR